jgi:serine-type D-Ala-D-Ala carboxypeptidase/endopeptidase (penicillin-binding protein 4)
MLAGMAAFPLATLAPRPRPKRPPIREVGAILAASRLEPVSGFAVADAATGEVLEAHAPDVARAPGSVAKVLTGLYALHVLGADHRFRTELREVRDGLALVGGGDPVLDTDALVGLALAAQERGVTGGSRFLVAAGALPALAEIEAGQPRHEAYNPAVSGLNLNFNRVHFAWDPKQKGGGLALTAPGSRRKARVRSILAELASAKGAPPLEHVFERSRERWWLSSRSASVPGSMWVPVRRPPLYAGEVFRDLAGQAGLQLPPPQVVGRAPEGAVVAAHESPALPAIVRAMLRYSTNLTAEVLGLAAAEARGAAPDGLVASARDMNAWAAARYGLEAPDLVNHSGLTDRSRISPADLLRVLTGEVGDDRLAPLLRPHPVPAGEGGGPEPRVVAKTGTLYFIRGLAGYLDAPGRRLAFAILAADDAARLEIRGPASAPPPGARDWLGRARRQEDALLRRWARAYAA